MRKSPRKIRDTIPTVLETFSAPATRMKLSRYTSPTVPLPLPTISAQIKKANLKRTSYTNHIVMLLNLITTNLAWDTRSSLRKIGCTPLNVTIPIPTILVLTRRMSPSTSYSTIPTVPMLLASNISLSLWANNSSPPTALPTLILISFVRTARPSTSLTVLFPLYYALTRKKLPRKKSNICPTVILLPPT